MKDIGYTGNVPLDEVRRPAARSAEEGRTRLSADWRELTRPRHRPQIHLPDTGGQQHARSFAQRAAGGHDVVDDGHVAGG